MFANLEWRVLTNEGSQALLIKDKSISGIPFQEQNKPVNWEDSHARRWLNNDFPNENFCKEEINALMTATVTADANPVYNTDSGQDTADRVYLLSSDEAERYHDILHDTETCWWLRTPGASKDTMSFVYPDRTVMNYGYDATDDTFSLKPVMWVDISE